MFPVFLFFSDLKMKKTIFSLFLLGVFFSLLSLPSKKETFFPLPFKNTHRRGRARKRCCSYSLCLSLDSLCLSLDSLSPKRRSNFSKFGGGECSSFLFFGCFSLKSLFLFLFPFAPLVSTLSPSVSLLLPVSLPLSPSGVPRRSYSALFLPSKRRTAPRGPRSTRPLRAGRGPAPSRPPRRS